MTDNTPQHVLVVPVDLPEPTYISLGESYDYDAAKESFTSKVGSEGWPVSLPWEMEIPWILNVDPTTSADLAELVNTYGSPMVFLAGEDAPPGVQADLWRSYSSATHHRFSMDHAKLAVHLLRAVGRHYVAVAEGRPTPPEWQAEGIAVGTEFGASTMLTRVLNPQLKRFGPQVSIDQDGEGPGEDIMRFSEAMAIALFRTMKEGRPVHRCGSETCGLPFVRREPGANQQRVRQRRVRFCSDVCANRQYRREHRRRQRAAHGGPEQQTGGTDE